jgi:pSer/pThr/pTyr-binding forkhead associated (FHA) protein
MWHIQISGPQLPSRRQTLVEGSTLMLGRAQDNDIVLADDRVSRRHAKITATKEGVRISDLSSRNGTLHNGKSLGRLGRFFNEGDVVTIGDYVVRLEHDGTYLVRGRTTIAREEAFVTLMSSAVSSPSTEVGPPPNEGEVRWERRFSSWMHALAQKLIVHGPSEAFLREVLACAVAVTGFEESLFLATQDADSFHPELQAPTASADPVWSTTLVRRAVESKATLFVHHLTSDPRFQTESIILARSLHVIVAPLMVEGTVLGAFYLSTRSAEIPSQAVIDFMSTLAQLAAQVRERMLTQEPSPEVVAALAPVTNSAQFLSATVRELAKVVSGYRDVLARCALTPKDAAELEALESGAGLQDLLEEAPRVAESLVSQASGIAERNCSP